MLPLLVQGKSSTLAREKSKQLLEVLGLSERFDHIPAHLSGGEAQRVAFARAIITEPKLLLADEPTGNLDETTADTVFSIMKEVCHIKSIAVIMVTHSMHYARSCDVVYRLAQKTLTKET